MSKFNSGIIERNYVYKRKADDASGCPHYAKQDRRLIVCLCGSTRFADQFHEANYRETISGHIVLSVGCLQGSGHVIQPELKADLDDLHLDKIDLADEVFVINVDGYVGESTRREVLYALAKYKTIRWLDPSKIPSDLARRAATDDPKNR